jgi:serine/threonine-protein kinase
LKGRFQLAKRSPDGLREAVVDFQRALSFDPRYAPALAGLADCYSLLAFYGLEPAGPLLRNALRTSEEALQIDSMSAEAYTSRAFARTLLNFDWDGAEADYKRAIQLDPNYMQAHAWYALELLTPEGREAEARAQMKFVQAKDPESLVAIVGLSVIEQITGHTEESNRLLQPLLNPSQPFESIVEIMSKNYLQENRGKHAIDLLRSLPVAPEDTDSREAHLAIAYALTGEPAKATQILQRLLEKVRAGEPSADQTAELYSALGDHKKAIEMLQIAVNKREPGVLFLNVDPLLAPLRGEQQFQTLLQQMHLQ